MATTLRKIKLNPAFQYDHAPRVAQDILLHRKNNCFAHQIGATPHPPAGFASEKLF